VLELRLRRLGRRRCSWAIVQYPPEIHIGEGRWPAVRASLVVARQLRGPLPKLRRGPIDNRAHSGLYVAAPLLLGIESGASRLSIVLLGDCGSGRVAVGEAMSSWLGLCWCGKRRHIVMLCIRSGRREEARESSKAEGTRQAPIPCHKNSGWTKGGLQGYCTHREQLIPNMSVASALDMEEGQNGRCVRNEPLPGGFWPG